MCGRYYVDEDVLRDIRRIVNGIECGYREETAWEPGAAKGSTGVEKFTGDVYPSQSAWVLLDQEGTVASSAMRWGFPPYQGRGLLINARAETILEKRTFRESIRHRRLAIPARHFYEWNRNKEKAVCYQAGKPTLYLAGCYDWLEEEKRFVVITTGANENLVRVHDRMPLLLEESELKTWLQDAVAAEGILRREPAPAQYRMEFQQINLFEGML